MNVEVILSQLHSKVIVGVDEVGRGSWAGPLVVGAVILNDDIAGLVDSKILSKQKRSQIAKLIKKSCRFYGTGWVSAPEVDELGLTKSTSLAIERSLKNIPKHDYIVIDGSINYLKQNTKALNLVKADALIEAVSAASIIAKVARDEYMAQQAVVYPDYGFNKHVGYGTSAHLQAIKDFGITPLHRKSYKPLKLLAAAK